MNDKLNSINGFHALLHDKGVEIHIPQSKDYNGVLIRTIPEAALCTPLPSSEGANGENNNGKWKRVVINFEVVKYDPTNTNDTFEILNKFEPPILLIVYITQDDLVQVNGVFKDLNLYYLPENKKEWKLFPSFERVEIENHTGKLTTGDTKVGFFTVMISEWGDPSVSVGQ